MSTIFFVHLTGFEKKAQNIVDNCEENNKITHQEQHASVKIR